MVHRRSSRGWAAALLVAGLWPGLAHAAGGGGGGAGGGSGRAGQPADPDYTAAVAAIQAQDYARAIGLLQGYVQRQPDDADGENWLAYANRKSGHLDEAFDHYAKALAIDPRHRGAHEYVGEAYLMAGNLAKAEEHLKVLDELCFFPCEEYSDLKAAVAAYRAGHGLPTASN